MMLPDVRGPGWGLGRIPSRVALIIGIVLSILSQIATSRLELEIHLTVGILLLALNGTLPWPRIFATSLLLTAAPIFLGNYIWPSHAAAAIGTSRAAAAWFFTARRLATLIYGFAWLFSVRPDRVAAMADRILRPIGARLALLATMLVATFPRVVTAYAQVRISIRFRLARGGRATLFRRLGQAMQEFRLTAIGAVVRFVALIPDLVVTMHMFGPRSAHLGEQRLAKLSLTPRRIRWREAVLETAPALDLSAGGICLVESPCGADRDAYLAWCGRIVPAVEGHAEGEIYWNGEELLAAGSELAATQGRLALIAPHYGTIGLSVTVEQHLRLATAPDEDWRATARRWDLESLLARPIEQLSGGQRYRCLLAGAFAAKPELMILDEPFGELDDRIGAILLDAIDETVANGAIAIVSDTSGTVAQLDRPIVSVTVAARDAAALPILPEPVTTAAPTVTLLNSIDRITIPARGLCLRASPPFEIASGRIVALSGPNGVGKTSLLEAVAGLLASDLRPPSRATIGYVMQGVDANAAALRVGDEIALARSNAAAADENPVMAMLGAYFEPLLKCYVTDLSTLKKRALAFYSMAAGARLLLCDEPDIYLSQPERQWITGLMRSFAAEGMAIVVASHSDRIRQSADVVVELEGSRA